MEWWTKGGNVFVRTVKHFFVCYILSWKAEGEMKFLDGIGKSMDFKHFFSPEWDGRKQVVDIQSLSFRDHLPLTLIYFGTTNKVEKKGKNVCLFFFDSLSSSHHILNGKPNKEGKMGHSERLIVLGKLNKNLEADYFYQPATSLHFMSLFTYVNILWIFYVFISEGFFPKGNSKNFYGWGRKS